MPCWVAVIFRKATRPIALFLLLALLLPVLSACGDPLAVGEGEILVHFLDVGQADCTLIRTRDTVILVDAGSDEPGVADGVVRYLRDLDIKEIDCLVLTHPHADHIGGAPTLFREFSIVECLLPALATDTPLFTELLDALEAEGCLVSEAVRGKRLTLGAVTLDVLSPDAFASGDENTRSAVVLAKYRESTLLLTADIPLEKEAELLAYYGEEALRADVLKVAHHGSATATGEQFLKALSPDYAVISCGRGNTYGCPSAEVLARLSFVGVTVYRTDTEGTVVLRGDGNAFSPIR